MNNDILTIVAGKCLRDQVAALAQAFPEYDLGLSPCDVASLRKFPTGGVPVCESCFLAHCDSVVAKLEALWPEDEDNLDHVGVFARFIVREIQVTDHDVKSLFERQELVRGLLTHYVKEVLCYEADSLNTPSTSQCFLCLHSHLQPRVDTELLHIWLKTFAANYDWKHCPPQLAVEAFVDDYVDGKYIYAADDIMTGRDFQFICEICGGGKHGVDSDYDHMCGCPWAFNLEFPPENPGWCEGHIRPYLDPDFPAGDTCCVNSCQNRVCRYSGCLLCRRCCLNPTCKYHGPEDSKRWRPPMTFLKLLPNA